MDTKGEYYSGEWILLGYDHTRGDPVLALSPMWDRVPTEQKVILLDGWVKLMIAETKKVLEQAKAEGIDAEP